jgi:hypothetical protein
MALKIVFVVFVILPFVVLWFGAPLVWRALRTEGCRGEELSTTAAVVYDRGEQPVMYYSGIAFWAFLFLIFGSVSLMLIAEPRWLFNS